MYLDLEGEAGKCLKTNGKEKSRYEKSISQNLTLINFFFFYRYVDVFQLSKNFVDRIKIEAKQMSD